MFFSPQKPIWSNVSENLRQFFYLLKSGSKLKKTGNDTLFYFGQNVFPKNFMHLKKKKK